MNLQRMSLSELRLYFKFILPAIDSIKRTYVAQVIGKVLPLATPIIAHMETFLHFMKGTGRMFPYSRLCPYLPLKLLFSLVNTA